MSVISTYKAIVMIPVFITIIVLLPNTSNGQSHEQNYFYSRRRIVRFSDTNDEGSSGTSLIFPKDHVPDNGDTSQSGAKEIPMEFFDKLNNVTDIEDFIAKFIDKNDSGLSIIGSEFERSAGQQPRAANCEPTLQVVPLEPYGSPNQDPEIYYYPKCTRIKQCSGCCNSAFLECTPIDTQENSFTVMKLRYTSTGSHILGKEAVSVQEHTACKCQCKIKERHCNAYQIYDEAHCKCRCRNNDEKDKCLVQPGKLWDATNCTCSCRHEVPCTTGSFFNPQTCQCDEIKVGNSRK